MTRQGFLAASVTGGGVNRSWIVPVAAGVRARHPAFSLIGTSQGLTCWLIYATETGMEW
jgi:hypothetical protein